MFPMFCYGWLVAPFLPGGGLMEEIEFIQEFPIYIGISNLYP